MFTRKGRKSQITLVQAFKTKLGKIHEVVMSYIFENQLISKSQALNYLKTVSEVKKSNECVKDEHVAQVSDKLIRQLTAILDGIDDRKTVEAQARKYSNENFETNKELRSSQSTPDIDKDRTEDTQEPTKIIEPVDKISGGQVSVIGTKECEIIDLTTELTDSELLQIDTINTVEVEKYTHSPSILCEYNEFLLEDVQPYEDIRQTDIENNIVDSLQTQMVCNDFSEIVKNIVGKNSATKTQISTQTIDPSVNQELSGVLKRTSNAMSDEIFNTESTRLDSQIFVPPKLTNRNKENNLDRKTNFTVTSKNMVTCHNQKAISITSVPLYVTQKSTMNDPVNTITEENNVPDKNIILSNNFITEFNENHKIKSKITDHKVVNTENKADRKKKIRNHPEWAWIKDIKLIRCVSSEEYQPSILDESLWKENVPFPGITDDDFKD